MVRGRAELETAKEGESLREGQTGERLVSREGAAQPGEYVTIVIHGPMRIKVSAEGGSIQPGTCFVVTESGVARALKTVVINDVRVAESAPVIGIALEAAQKDGYIWVLVNPQ